MMIMMMIVPTTNAPTICLNLLLSISNPYKNLPLLYTDRFLVRHRSLHWALDTGDYDQTIHEAETTLFLPSMPASARAYNYNEKHDDVCAYTRLYIRIYIFK